DERLLGAMGFGASAWKVAPRDTFIGWSPEERQQGLHLIVGQSRFLGSSAESVGVFRLG
ncbi:hypothetical protein B1A_12545, partial [mine drainage metagenome]